MVGHQPPSTVVHHDLVHRQSHLLAFGDMAVHLLHMSFQGGDEFPGSQLLIQIVAPLAPVVGIEILGGIIIVGHLVELVTPYDSGCIGRQIRQWGGEQPFCQFLVLESEGCIIALINHLNGIYVLAVDVVIPLARTF